MASNNNNRRFQGANDLEGIDLRNLVKTPENYLGSGAYGDVYYVKDINGIENQHYAVKFIRKNDFIFTKTLRSVFGNKFPLIESIDKEFRKEVKTLYELKDQGIGPDIVYANYTKNYYIIEKMEATLDSMIRDGSLRHKHALMFLALIDRYIKCDYFHTDFHSNNIMWSDTLHDFRIIDWGIGIRIAKIKEPQKTLIKKKRIIDLMEMDTFWVIMVYIKYCLDTEKDELKIKKWNAMAKKYSKWLSNNLEPQDIGKYDIFNEAFSRKKQVEKTLKLIKKALKNNKKRKETPLLFGRLEIHPKKKSKKKSVNN
jgi:tRNA A-37 threonylcarbamoyl transferase component Bud32